MSIPSRAWRVIGIAVLVLLVLATVAPFLLPHHTRFPLWPIDPASEYATRLDRVWMVVMIVGIGVTLLVGSLMVYAVTRFGTSDPMSDDEPPQIHGNSRLELTWTLIPILIVTVLLFIAVSTLQLNNAPSIDTRNALVFNIRGYQWGWSYTSPQLPGLLVPSGDLHVPVNRPLDWRVTSSDVVHDWFVPALDGHMDAYPGHIVRIVLTATRPGVYYAQCSKFCGLRHWLMHNNVYVDSPAAFARWAVSKGANRTAVTSLLHLSTQQLAALPAPGHASATHPV